MVGRVEKRTKQDMTVDNIFSGKLNRQEGIWMGPSGGYWSNLNKEENNAFLKDLPTLGAKKTVETYFPQHYETIFSPKRAGGLPLLDPKAGEVVVDTGCMWGALTIPLAKAGCKVVAIDQTHESLLLLKQRLKDEDLDNVELVCADIKEINYLEGSVDKFVVNGVLEWVPETGTIELKKYYGKRSEKKNASPASPYDIQLEFLENIHRGLKKGGTLYLAIENRFDLFYFLGLPDLHCNLRLITFLPRFLQTIVSKICLGRPYVNWIYSERMLRKILTDAGFTDISVFYTFPNYRFPEYILTGKGMGFYHPSLYKRRKSFAVKALCYAVENLIFNKFRLKFFSPSFIVIARK